MNEVAIKNIYPLTPMQEGLLFHDMLNNESEAYFDQTVITIKEKLDLDLFRKSFQLLVNRHDALRTLFVYKETKQPLQIILEGRDVDVKYEDISYLSQIDQDKYITDFTSQDRQDRFDLEKDTLIRMTVLDLNKSSCKLILSFHHIIMDGWCIGTIIKDLFQIYRAMKQNTELNLDPVYPYSEYIHWLEKQNKMEAKAYWEQNLEGITGKSTISGDNQLNKITEYKLENNIFTFDKELSSKLTQIAQYNEVTMSTVFHALWAILLQKYNYTDDVVFGSVVSGRPPEVEGIENMIGLFINTVPIRVQARNLNTFSELVLHVQETMMNANKNHYISLADIQALSPIKSDLIHHIIAFENYPVSEEISGEGTETIVQVGEVDGFEQTNYDFNIGVIPGEEYKIKFAYNAYIYSQDHIETLKSHLKEIALQVAEHPMIKLEDIHMINLEERQLIVCDFNNTSTSFPEDKMIHQLFEEQVKKMPDRLAIVSGEEKLSYKELNEKSNDLAHILRQKGVEADQVIGIATTRSCEMMIGLMAILKAGAAYLPINPNDPVDRIRYILQDSGAKVVLAQQQFVSQVRGYDNQLDIININKDKSYNTLDLEPVASPNHLAYIIYTSGSTGRPKGVMIEHKSLINRLNWMQKKYPLNETDVILQKTSYTFDVSVWELFLWALSGSTLCMLAPEEEKDPESIVQAINKYSVTNLHFIPSMLSVFLDYVQAKRVFKELRSIRRVFTSGEALLPVHVEQFNKLLYEENGTSLHNLYGPTEATIDVTYYDCPITGDVNIVPIGKPIDNTRLYIVDQAGKLLPIGIPGELCIAGVGLARGYINNRKLTEEKFLLGPVENERVYRTGDLARWLPDGNIEYLGRMDHQVKIRGFRIELGEIETKLLNNRNVKEAIVVAYDDYKLGKYLCAYLVTEFDLEPEAVKEYLRLSLPEYMVPTHMVILNELPRLSNGKLNRKALPKPEQLVSSTTYVPPSNEIDRRLVKIWENVLNMNHIGIKDHFFELGGHSLKATLLLVAINSEFNINIKLKDIFDYPTLEELSSLIAKQDQSLAYSEINPIDDGRSYYPVSFSQKRQLVLTQLEDTELSYNMPAALMIHGEINKDRVEEVLQKIVDRHEAFRTSFHWNEGQPVQKIHENIEFELDYKTISEKNKLEKVMIEDEIRSCIHSFDLEVPPLLRATLIKFEETKHLLVIDMHHIVSDGVSISILVSEFNKLYSGDSLEPLSIQYKDYAVWQIEEVEKGKMKEQESYWMNIFKDEIPILNLPTDMSRPTLQTFKGSTITRILDKKITEKISKVMKEQNVTLYMVLLTAYNVLLSKYSGQEDIIIGSPVSGRRHPKVNNTIGVFINTVALRNFPSAQKTFAEFLLEVKENTLSAFEHQEYPFEMLVEKLDLRRDINRNPIFDTMFVMQEGNQQIKVDGTRITPVSYNPEVSKFDLTLSAAEDHETIQLNFEYSSALFYPQSVERIANHFMQILDRLLENQNAKINQINMVSLLEENTLIREFNRTNKYYPKNETIHQMFEKQVERTPDRIAVRFEGSTLTYRQLNEKANHLARVLRGKGVAKDQIVGISVHRSLEMMIGLLAILKAGGAYLPIQPEDPTERFNYLIEDSQTNLVLTQRHLKDELESRLRDVEIVSIEDELLVSTVESSQNLNLDYHENDMMYVIYTSGSTGKPKGVMVEHASLINRLNWMIDAYQFDQNDIILQKTPYTFDVSLWELFAWALQGASVSFLPPGGEKDPSIITKTIEDSKVTILHFVPSMLNVFLEYVKESGTAKRLQGVRYVFASGEALMSEHVKRFNNLWHHECGTTLHNLYGPTEATVDVSYYDCPTENEAVPDLIPIGRPIDNTRLYILDQHKQVVPIGVSGELHIAGDCLARGYLNREELTAKTFVNDPFVEGEKMYKTGDLVRWKENGEIEYLGRIDHQVKIRGHRIELGEIEQTLLQHEVVQETVVLAKQNKNESPILCAYIVSHTPISEIAFRNYLNKRLPEYMVPKLYIQLEQMPLLSNGKVNRKALPDPAGQLKVTVNYVPPANEIEKLLVNIWSEVLNYDGEIGTHHNFFELGGDSIKAIQVATRLNKFNLKMNIKDLLQLQTIAALSPYIKEERRKIEQGIVTGKVKLSPIQKWFFEESCEDMEHWNQSVMLYSEMNLEKDVLKIVFEKLVEHHDALRTTYKIEEKDYIGVINDVTHTAYSYEVVDLRKDSNYLEEIERIANQTQKQINLYEGPLVHTKVFQTEKGDYLLIVIHHLVIDGISWRVILEDLESGYMQGVNGKDIVFQDKTNSWKDWINEIYEYVQTNEFKKHKGYWSSIENKTYHNLFKTVSDKERTFENMDQFTVALSKKETDLLLSEAHYAYGTEINDLLLTALGMALKSSFNRSDFTITLEGHGREELFKDMNVTRTVGWFTTMYPIHLDMQFSESLSYQIKHIKESLRRIPNKGIDYGIYRYINPSTLNQAIGQEIRFNYHGQIEQETKSHIFANSNLSTGKSVSPNAMAPFALDINGSVEEDSLLIKIEFNKYQFSIEDIMKLANEFIHRLLEVINHCTNKTEKELTPNDVGNADLSIEDLNSILNFYND
ncbi:amino acid adenylation domain-containing protein [Bacillus sp. FJAT-51639]|uniref:amino acid adenylation domain-containing protein n=1 Tax=Bacillus bruguierae TaxID=3127667 RepID=UPI0030139004